MFKTRNIGSFKVSTELLENCVVQGNHIQLSDLFRGMVVIDVKYLPDADHRVYIALHPSFRIVMFGTMIPEYDAKIDSLTGDVEWIEKPVR